MQCNGDAMVPFYSQELAVKAIQEKQMVFPGKMELFVVWKCEDGEPRETPSEVTN